MERLDRRLAEAAAALARLDELAGKNERNLIERDGAVLRLIFTFEAVWKACQKLLPLLKTSVPHRRTQRYGRRAIWDG